MPARKLLDRISLPTPGEGNLDNDFVWREVGLKEALEEPFRFNRPVACRTRDRYATVQQGGHEAPLGGSVGVRNTPAEGTAIADGVVTDPASRLAQHLEAVEAAREAL